jgi:hypothetical protein
MGPCDPVTRRGLIGKAAPNPFPGRNDPCLTHIHSGRLTRKTWSQNNLRSIPPPCLTTSSHQRHRGGGQFGIEALARRGITGVPQTLDGKGLDGLHCACAFCTHTHLRSPAVCRITPVP